MRIGFKEFVINPVFPVYRMLSEEKHLKCFDDLHCRVFVMESRGRPLYHLSIDSVEIYKNYRDRIKREIEGVLKIEIDLIVSVTHSHCCPCLTTDSDYRDYLITLIKKNITDIEIKEYKNITYCYQFAYFDKVGNSRIPGHKSRNIYAETLSFFCNDKRIGTILIHNVHPTIKKIKTEDFTSEYPGNVIANLKERYPGEFFTFMLGPAGDLSPRYVRQNQEYSEIGRLSLLLTEEYERQLQNQNYKKAVDAFEYSELEFPIKHVVRTLDNIELPEVLNEEEIKVIERVRSGNLKRSNEIFEKHIFGHWVLSSEYSIIFEPFELFSGFYDCVEKTKCSLITVSNGFDHYVTDIGPQRLTMQQLHDTVSDLTKRDMCSLFTKWSRLE